MIDQEDEPHQVLLRVQFIAQSMQDQADQGQQDDGQ